MTVAIYMAGFFIVYGSAFLIGYMLGAVIGIVNSSLF